MDESGCVVLVLADGVGSCADDSRASKTTCDLFLGKCRTALKDSKVLTEERLARFCREIDPVLAVDNDMACFCAVVWYVNSRNVVWLHVGDTRIYRYNIEEGLVQMTRDDHGKAVNIKVNGKLYTDHGALVSATPIDNAIGDRQCNFHTGQFEFNPGDSIILSSDGMYNSSSFGDDMKRLLNEADISAGIEKVDTNDDDDHSLLVLRLNLAVDNEIGLSELMGNFEALRQTIPFSALIERVANELEASLDSANMEVGEVAKIVTLMRDEQLYPDRRRIDRIFTKALNRLNVLPEGEEKQRFNAVCMDLKDVLRYVFTH